MRVYIHIHTQIQRYPPGFSSVLRAGDESHVMFFGCRQIIVPNHAMCAREENKIEGDIYILRERKKDKDKERLGDREREVVHIHTYMNAQVNMFVCMFEHTFLCIHIPLLPASSSNLDFKRSRDRAKDRLERSIDW